MNVLITGHRGYIGTVLSNILTKEGHRVFGLDTHYFSGCCFNDKDVRVFGLTKDIREVDLTHLLAIDSIIHLAALSNDVMGDINPDLTNEINTEATIRLAILARGAGVRRFLYMSSCSVYGAEDNNNGLVETSPLNPITQYAKSKIESEKRLMDLASDEFSVTSFRSATAYGVSPYLRTDLVINRMMATAYADNRINIMGSGHSWRPFIHVEDIARAYLEALKTEPKVLNNHIINLGINSENYKISDLADMAKSVITTATIEHLGKDTNDPRSYKVNFNKLNNLLPDFQPRWTVLSGMKSLYDAYIRYGLSSDEIDGIRYNRIARLKYLMNNNILDENLYWKNND